MWQMTVLSAFEDNLLMSRLCLVRSDACSELESHEGYYSSLVQKSMGQSNLATDEIDLNQY